LAMISQDFTEWPEHRSGFFQLLKAIDRHCFPALINLPPAQFKMLMDSVVWGIKHTMRDISDITLGLTLELINNFAAADSVILNAFCAQYYMGLVQDIFFVLTDTDHKSGFKTQANVLSRMFQLVEKDTITAPLFDAATVNDPEMTNKKYLRIFLGNLFRNAFPHLLPQQVDSYVAQLCEYHSDANKFKVTLRDFLIQLREYSGQDTEALFIDDKLDEQRRKADEEREAAMKVPGMLKPSQLDQDEDL